MKTAWFLFVVYLIINLHNAVTSAAKAKAKSHASNVTAKPLLATTMSAPINVTKVAVKKPTSKPATTKKHPKARLQVKNPYCDLKCGNFTHTVCNRNQQKCGVDRKLCGNGAKVIRLTEQERQLMLDMHNTLRCKVALGKEKLGKQPPAANMRTMTYDRELEFISQCWANTCNIETHDHCRRTKKWDHVGQNIGYVSSSGFYNRTIAMLQLTKYWYDEVADYDRNWINDTQDRVGVKVGHYTQLLWADSHRLGCAAIQFPEIRDGFNVSTLFFVCNYGPGGNYFGNAVYKIGPAGAACPKNKRNKQCRALCGENVRVAAIPKMNTFFSL